MVDYQSYGYEWLAAIWAEGVPGQVKPLTCDVTELSLYEGGTANFYLNAGPDYADRSFGLFGTLSGTSPGTPLPGGLVTLPINWDWFTDLMIYLGGAGFWYPFGVLDGGLSQSL